MTAAWARGWRGWPWVLGGFGAVTTAAMAVYAAPDIGTGWALLDSLPGWTFLVCGVIAWRARPASRVGFLLVLAGVLLGLGVPGLW